MSHPAIKKRGGDPEVKSRQSGRTTRRSESWSRAWRNRWRGLTLSASPSPQRARSTSYTRKKSVPHEWATISGMNARHYSRVRRRK